uniref:Uncharacterized protein n=1 Tax=Globodera rostochiensis TaxID=31243 RepID=A0A914HI70_GLORO
MRPGRGLRVEEMTRPEKGRGAGSGGGNAGEAQQQCVRRFHPKCQRRMRFHFSRGPPLLSPLRFLTTSACALRAPSSRAPWQFLRWDARLARWPLLSPLGSEVDYAFACVPGGGGDGGGTHSTSAVGDLPPI